MSKCQYCEKEFPKGTKMHEKYCKSKPITEQKQEISNVIPQGMPADGMLLHKEHIQTVKQPSWISKLFKKKVKPQPQIVTFEETIAKLPKWAIKEGKPWFVGENKKRKLIQFVGVSKLKPPVMAWVFWDGIFVQVEDRLYRPPHDIRGNVFFYDLDNSRPLLDNIEQDEETHESLRMAQVKNIAYAMGRIAGAQDLLKNLGLILLGIGFIVLLGIANLYLSYQAVQGFAVANDQIGNITTAVQHYITTHP